MHLLFKQNVSSALAVC